MLRCLYVVYVTIDGERSKDVFDIPVRNESISCKHFSLQRAPHAGVFEAAALIFDAQEESLGPARAAPLHRVLIHLGPRNVDFQFRNVDVQFVHQ